MSTGFPCPPIRKKNKRRAQKKEILQPTFLENFGRHILQKQTQLIRRQMFDTTSHPRGATDFSQHIQLFLFHDPAQTKISNHDIS